MKTMMRAMAIVGAVIGAGFASGREIVSFFSQYGAQAWWLMALAAAVMAALCYVKVENSIVAKLCIALLSALTGGAMISAAGQLIALCWESRWAYSLGAAGTLALAWWMAHGSLRPLEIASATLSVGFVAVLVIAMRLPGGEAVSLAQQTPGASIRAVGYAAMNMTLAIGVVQRCQRTTGNGKLALCFGGVMLMLMALSHLLYSRHPQWMGEAFPMVRVLSAFGRTGFWVSVTLMYLSIFTSLTAILCSLQSATSSAWLSLGLPLALSCVGFEGIVDGWYAPAGLLCLMLVFGWALLLTIRQRCCTMARTFWKGEPGNEL